jgi:hypothetical protein
MPDEKYIFPEKYDGEMTPNNPVEWGQRIGNIR